MPKMKFQWFFDLHTRADTMQIITVSAGGKTVYDRLKPFFSAYKRYKLGAVTMSAVPASTLPVDPTGLSLEAGDTLVDPRDQLNPGLTRITNGEDFFDDVSQLTDEQQIQVYNAMMLDRRWYKWPLQSGLKRRAYPKYWTVGQLHQDYFPGATVNVPMIGTGTDGKPVLLGTVASHMAKSSGSGISAGVPGGGSTTASFTDPRGLFQTGHKGRLGWMPTDALIQFGAADGTHERPMECPIPSIELFKVILPKAYKTVYYWRCYVTEEVSFCDPIVTANLYGTGTTGLLDRFVVGQNIRALPYGPIAGHAFAPPNDGTENKEAP